jgi:hypothetical protein
MCNRRLNCRLKGAILVPKVRQPFDVLIEGLQLSKSRGDWTAIELFVAGVRGWGSWRWRQLENSQSA